MCRVRRGEQERRAGPPQEGAGHAEERNVVVVTLKGDVVEFLFFRPQAERVHLAGDFNDWREGELSMQRRGDGYWLARMRLPIGEFRIKYCADGQWFTDFAAFGVEPGQFGLDSVVRVPAQPLKVAYPTDIGQTAAA